MPGPDTDFDLDVPDFATAGADAVYPHGAYLRCHKCYKKRKASRNECETFLRRGWPECCGETMVSTPRPEPLAPQTCLNDAIAAGEMDDPAEIELDREENEKANRSSP